MTRREGSGVILIDAQGRVLLQQRDDEHPPAGYGRWAIPGGGREGDESPRETALREFEEETGVRLDRLRFFRTVTREMTPDLFIDRLDLFFADDAVPRERIEVNEGLDFQYWAPAEIDGLLMNPVTRAMLTEFLASDMYRGTVAWRAEGPKSGVSILELDRWGRVLLQLRDSDLPPERFPDHWSTLGGLIEPGEAPDAAAFREFEEETGHMLESLKLYRAFRRDELPGSTLEVWHVYYVDADLDVEILDVNEGQALGYFGPGDLAGVPVPPPARAILEGFFVSPAYKAMFH
ncbi:MAG: NUDIX domain-containing protein [Dehalococcoidia bacterium]